MTDWLMPSEISDVLGQPGFKGPQRLTSQKVGRVLRDLGLVDDPEVCRSETKELEASNTGRTFTQRYYDFGKIQDDIVAKMKELWPPLMLKNGDIAIPDYVAEREEKLNALPAPAPAVEETGTKWSEYQTAIFKEVELGNGNVVVIARAGSGKTTTIVESLNYTKTNIDILLCAFNKDIQTELESRAPRHVKVRTVHSLGFEICRRHFGRRSKTLGGSKSMVDKFKVFNLIDEVLRSDGGKEKYKSLSNAVDLRTGQVIPGGGYKSTRMALSKLVSLCKNTLSIRQPERLKLYFEYNIGDTSKAELMCQAAGEVLKRNDDITDSIDYDDMIYFPWRHNLSLGNMQFDMVMVDEAQDLNAAQLWFIQTMCRSSGRIVALGDDRQAIYGFRGADRQAIPKLIEGLGAQTLPLSVSYRCARAIVGLAQSVVPDIEWSPNAAEGTIGSCEIVQVMNEAKPGDFILSRVNAPLAGICMAFLKRGIPAIIAGKDIGKQIEDLIRRSKSGTLSELFAWLDKWLEKERKDSLPDRAAHYYNCVDKADVIKHIANMTGSVTKLIVKVNEMFSDDTPGAKIVCSTVHKAKGMERDRVWMLQDTFKPAANVEEANIWYVSVTRAKSELYLCETPAKEILSWL